MGIVRVLRIILPICFFAFLALLVASYTRSYNGKKAEAREVVPTRPNEGPPQIISYAFDDVQTVAGRVVSKVRAGRVMAFKSGWYTLENVELTIFRKNGASVSLSCERAEFQKDTREAKVQGGVKVSSSDGMELSTEALLFDGEKLVNEIPVAFRVDDWKGNAGGLELEIEQGRLRLVRGFNGRMEPAVRTEPPMTVTSREALFLRNERRLELKGGTTVTRTPDRFRASNVVARFDQTGKKLVSLEGQENVIVEISSSSVNGGAGGNGGQNQIHADRMIAELDAAGALRVVDAKGEGKPARAILAGALPREIEAGGFRLLFAAGAPSELTAEPAVTMKEGGPIPRTIKGNRAVVAFDTATRRPTGAIVDGSFRYQDPKTEADAERANYDFESKRVVMTALEGSNPVVRTDGQTLRAKVIEFSAIESALKATGGVVARLVSKQATSANDSMVFPSSGGAVFVNSDLLVLRQATRSAIFTGNVRAWQDTNTLFAGELHIQNAGELIEGKGGVRTVLYNARGQQRKAPVLTRSDSMKARKADRRIDLEGSVRVDDESRTMIADAATLFFDEGRKVERMEAKSNLTLTEKLTGRKGAGDRLTYQIPQRLIFLNGSPATITEPSGTVRGEEIVFDLAKNKVEVVRGKQATETEYTPQ